MNEAKLLLNDIEFSENIEECLKDADALVLLTEWNEFRSLTASKLRELMKGNILIDLRNALNPENFDNTEFSLIQIGRPIRNNADVNQ